jgi:MoaA/NifB/PqqE/SkfB family radical SAM enzyme
MPMPKITGTDVACSVFQAEQFEKTLGRPVIAENCHATKFINGYENWFEKLTGIDGNPLEFQELMKTKNNILSKKVKNGNMFDTNSLRFMYNHLQNRFLNSTKRPTYAYIIIETICNSKCNYCDMWGTKKGDQPNTEEWKGIIDDIRSVGVISLTFSGGEPFLNRDLFELAGYAKSKGLYTMVVTNMSLFNDDWIEKIAQNFDFFGISIDSTKPEIYQETRGVNWLEHTKQSVHKLMDGLASIKGSTAVCAMVTVSNRNAYEMHDILQMVFDDLNMDCISFNLLDPKGSTTAKDFIPTEDQIRYYRQTILENKKIYPILNSTRYLEQSGNYDYKCNPWKCVHINHEGTLIAPCTFMNEKRFNLRETRLLDVWNQKSTQEIYKHYDACRSCNLGCIAETAWSTYDLDFVIKENFMGMILPMWKRIGERNHSKLKQENGLIRNHFYERKSHSKNESHWK